MVDPTLPALPETVAWLMDTGDDASWAEVDEGIEPEAECPSVKRVVPLVTLQSAIAYAEERVAQESERCAKVCESQAGLFLSAMDNRGADWITKANWKHEAAIARGCAAAIRKTPTDTKGTA